MTIEAAADLLGITEQHARRLAKDGILPATRTGRSWDIANNLDEVVRAYQKGQHRNPRPKRTQTCRVAPTTGDTCYWSASYEAAKEVARIAEQCFKTPSQIDSRELSQGEWYWVVSNASVITGEKWMEVARAAYRFLAEMGLRDEKGDVVDTFFQRRRPLKSNEKNVWHTTADGKQLLVDTTTGEVLRELAQAGGRNGKIFEHQWIDGEWQLMRLQTGELFEKSPLLDLLDS